MIDKYIILNKKMNIVMRVFIYNIILLTGLIIWCINTIPYQKYFLIHSQISSLNSYYCIEVLIPVKEVNRVISKNTLWINRKKYTYKVLKKDEKIIYKNKTNYLKLYLEVNNLEKEYLIDGYHIDVMFKEE